VDIFVIATDVPGVAIDYGTEHQRFLARLDVNRAWLYAAQGQFPEGSMLPKIQAAIRFLEGGGKRAVITSVEAIEEAVAARAGTEVIRG